MQLQELLERAGQYLPPERLSFIQEAHDFARQAHDGQSRLSGEPFLEHPLQTAAIVASLQLDATTIAAALLHDVVEDAGVKLEEVRSRFGEEVARLVDGATKLSRIELPARRGKSRKGEEGQAQVESLRKMLLAMAEDIRVVLIKLADRLHNMRTLEALPSERRLEVARETLEIYVPLAHRLGVWGIKEQLEDMAFRYLQPAKYREIARLVVAKRVERERYIALVTRLLKEELEKAGVKVTVSGRAKHLYSIYKKMGRYAAQGKEFSDIYDLLALRVLVDSVSDCYGALGVIHSLFRPLPGQFDDYIANPKENLYQALHTTVMGPHARPLEIQIRTYEMHRVAEYGVAAHWRYKEGVKKGAPFEDRMAWLRQLLEWQRELTGAEFLESVKTDIFSDQVFVFTPKGEIKELPAGSTPIDFAYRIHTELGHRCIGGKVNGRLVSLSYQLRNGDTVEILAAKGEKGPSRDWLNLELGYVQSSHAREKIRQWFRKQERGTNIQLGKEILDKELRRLGLSLTQQEKVAALFKYESLDEFLAALGCGDISSHQVAVKLTAQEPRLVAPVEKAPLEDVPTTAIQVLGVGDLLTRLAQCCHPVPGDKIIGYITRSRGVSIHRQDCPNIVREEERERLIPVDWGRSGHLYPVRVQIEAMDRVGLLRDISTMVSEDKINILSINNAPHEDGTVTINATLQITGIEQLRRLLSRLEGVKGVLGAARSVDGARPKTE